MTLRKLRELWDDFFFTPQSPLPIAVFRIFYGICVSVTILLLHADWLNWYGVDAWVSLPAMKQVEPGVRLNLFTVMPQDDRWIASIFLGLSRLRLDADSRPVDSVQQRSRLPLPYFDSAEKSPHPSRRGCLPARDRLFPHLCTRGGCAFPGSLDTNPQRTGRNGDSTKASLGATHDPIRTRPGLSDRLLVEDEGTHLAERHRTLLRAPHALAGAVSPAGMDAIRAGAQGRRLVHPRLGVFARCPHLVPAVSLPGTVAGPALPHVH